MPDRPDILLVLTDQQRHDQVGYVAGSRYDTPNLSLFASRGVVFDAAYSASTTCVPARVGLLTGLLHHRVPTQDNLLALREGFWTVAHALGQAGYETALIGKAHFYPMRAQHGFETVRLCEHLNTYGPIPGGRGTGVDLDDYHDWLRAQGYGDWRLAPNTGSADQREFPYDERLHPTAWVEEEACRFLERRDPTRPLFLVVSFPHPHAPLNPPERYMSMYRSADVDLPSAGFEVNERLPPPFVEALTRPTEAFRPQRVDNDEQLRRRLRRVQALIKQIDDSLGRVLERVDLARSVVFFTSDHGDYAGHRGMLAKFPWIPFDDLARVPMVVAGTGIRGGRRVGHLVQNCDFALTALDYAGVSYPKDVFDTRSLRPLLEEREGWSGTEDRAVLCGTGVMGWPTLRRGALKYISHAGSGASVLFDLDQDPGETTNVIELAGYRSAATDLAALLERALDRPVPDLPAFATPARP